jgi:hypothetical protein
VPSAGGATLGHHIPRVLAAVAVVVAATGVPERVRDAWSDLRAPHGDAVARELTPATAWGVSGDALLLAEQTIPRDATIAVAVGDVPPLDAYAKDAVDRLFCDWLLPRRCVGLDRADWVITYHRPSEGLPVHGREYGLGPDANAVRVER